MVSSSSRVSSWPSSSAGARSSVLTMSPARRCNSRLTVGVPSRASAPRGGQPSRLLNQSGDEPDDVVELRAAEKGGGSRKSGQAEPL
jgi:hypothetical protein